MFCNVFHHWTDWQQYSASNGLGGKDIELGEENTTTLQFRDCSNCSKRQIRKIKYTVVRKKL